MDPIDLLGQCQRPVRHHESPVPDHRPGRGFARSFYRSLSESHHAVRECHLDARQAHLHLRRQLRLHATQHPRRRTNQGIIVHADFSPVPAGLGHHQRRLHHHQFLQGNANRYYRAGQSGAYIQDKFQFRSNLSLTAGLRWDWDGGLTEKYGRIFNFDPSLYSYDDATDTITSNGFIIAGNNKLFPTKGVSNTTLTGRQWGFAPRLGVAWSPKKFNDKVVVRAGTRASTTIVANSSPIFRRALRRA